MALDIELTKALKNYTSGFASIVPFDSEKDQLVSLDFTKNNIELTEDILNDTGRFSAYINMKLKYAHAVYGIGGYDEHRTIYKRSAVFDGEEPRRLHLGLDIWGDAGTPVYAPLEGTVHSFAFNDNYGDYGATLILQHELEGIIFHTLYGHLSLHSIEDKKEGQIIEKGEWIAAFGNPEENGHWPPHLHFQLIIDLEGMKGDYPGVCKYSDRQRYLANCPDPEVMVNLKHFLKVKK
jgi:murein DD-endopeptidase MepM/ murein hydrolase activator NlpD